MAKIEIFDPALCCSTGVCGTEVDQALVSFSADVDWLKRVGGQIERFNLAQQPMAFVENAAAKAFLERSGADALPRKTVRIRPQIAPTPCESDNVRLAQYRHRPKPKAMRRRQNVP